jgi:anti-sigma factor RsiW
MARVTRDELARYRDGELSASERKRVEEALRTAPAEDRAHLEKLDKLGDLLRVMHEEQVSRVSFDGFAARVAEGVRATEKPGFGERLGVWLAEFFAHRRAVWIPAASLVGAAAAVLLVLPLVRGPQQSVPLPQAAAGGTWQAGYDVAQAMPAVPHGSEAVLASGGQIAGLAFKVPNERGELIGVVWVND